MRIFRNAIMALVLLATPVAADTVASPLEQALAVETIPYGAAEW